MHWSQYGLGMGLGWLVIAVFWVLVIASGAYLVRFAVWRAEGHEHRDAPLDMLQNRYARGEITRAEFERMKNGRK